MTGINCRELFMLNHCKTTGINIAVGFALYCFNIVPQFSEMFCFVCHKICYYGSLHDIAEFMLYMQHLIS